ncbi:MAG: ATP-grasp domain-containing protein [Candidatus Helarchaeota archaeon]
MKRILVTGSGGVAGVNFVRAIRISPEKFFIAGTDFNIYYLNFPEIDLRFQTPRHTDPTFIQKVGKIMRHHQLEFLHPQPESEAYVISSHRDEIPAVIFLPQPKIYEIGQDKASTANIMKKSKVPVPKTYILNNEDTITEAFAEIDSIPLWLRARKGAGGKMSLSCNSPEEAIMWCKIWLSKGIAQWTDFIIQEYLPGRNYAWDSLWFEGKLITSYSRERLQYIYKNVSPSGITGTPTIARTIHNDKVNKISEDAVKAIDSQPHGFYCVDLKEDINGIPNICEINVGKFHTTGSLWSYAVIKSLKLPWYANISYLYVKIAFDNSVPDDPIPQFDLYPPDIYLIRHIDAGAFLWREDGWKERIL